MTDAKKMQQSNLLVTLKDLLNEKRFSSQLQLVKALSIRGFENVSQTQISRLINKSKRVISPTY